MGWLKQRLNAITQRQEKEMARRDENLRGEIRQAEQAIKSDMDLRFQESGVKFEEVGSRITHSN